MNEDDRLQQRLEQQAQRFRKAERERHTLLAQTVFVGTLGLLLALPVVVGAYLGNWLDRQMSGFSIRWTVSLILLGVVVGAVNVYLFIRER